MSAVSLGLKRRLIFTCYDYPGLISRFSLPVRVPLVAQMQSYCYCHMLSFSFIRSTHPISNIFISYISSINYIDNKYIMS